MANVSVAASTGGDEQMRVDIASREEAPNTAKTREPAPRPASPEPSPVDSTSLIKEPTPGTSFLQRFLSSFFEERNIKWLLVIGAGIIFGSSLMLVTREWSHWSATLKYLTVLGYTAVAFCAAEVGRERLGLITTSRVLQALTLLLLPVCFTSLSWMSSSTATQPVLESAQPWLLFAPTVALTWFAARRILAFMLNGRQTTFVLSYQLLCVAGIMPNTVATSVESATPADQLMAIAIMIGFWLVFTVGVIKVNRHTFWLSEEQRAPRIFGFFRLLFSVFSF